MDDGPPIFNQDFTCPSLLVRVLSSSYPLRIRDFHPVSWYFPEPSTRFNDISHQAPPRSLAATWRISFDFFSFGYLDVSVPRVRFRNLCIQSQMTSLSQSRVPPFGHLRITARFQLPKAFRRIPRPSSPLTAKASTVCASLLDHITSTTSLQRPFRSSSSINEKNFAKILKTGSLARSKRHRLYYKDNTNSLVLPLFLYQIVNELPDIPDKSTLSLFKLKILWP